MNRLLWGMLLWFGLGSLAQASDLTLFSVLPGEGGAQDYNIKLQILFFMTVLGLLPTLLLMMTSFTRIIVVLAILRQALGLQQSPSNQVLIGLALFLSLFIMTPVLDKINNDALQPYLNDQMTSREAFDKAQVPLHSFMLEQTRIKDLNSFMEFANIHVDKPEEVPMRVLIPAFMISELKTAFQIGFMIFLPFLVIDLVVASILMAMGMMMLSPMIISLPFKLMLFVMVDGWGLIMGSLVNSFGIGGG